MSSHKAQRDCYLSFCLCLIAFVTSISASAQSQGSRQNSARSTEPICAVYNYEVLSPHAVALQCNRPVGGELKGLGKLFLGSATGTQITDQVVLTVSKASRYWILLAWTPADSTALAPGKTYAFRLPIRMPPIVPTALVEDAGEPDLHVASISTKNAVSIVANLLASQPARFQVTSHVAFSSDGKTLAVAKRDPKHPGKRELGPCNIPATTLTSQETSLKANCSQFDFLPNSESSALVDVDLSLVGIYDIEIHPQPSAALVPVSLPIRDIFGNIPQFDPKARFARQDSQTRPRPLVNALSVSRANFHQFTVGGPGVDEQVIAIIKQWKQLSQDPALSDTLGSLWGTTSGPFSDGANKLAGMLNASLGSSIQGSDFSPSTTVGDVIHDVLS